MSADLELMEWARKHALRIREEGRLMFPGDEVAQATHARKSIDPALRLYREEMGTDAPERLWTFMDMWNMVPSEVLAAPYQPIAPEDTAPVPVTSEHNLEYAGLLCRTSNGRSPGRCSWHTNTATQCAAPVPDTEFFCRSHAAELGASGDPYVRAAWDRLQAEAVSYREMYPKDATSPRPAR